MNPLAILLALASFAPASALPAADLAPAGRPAASEDFAGSFSAAPVLALDYSPPVSTPVETLLKAIEAAPAIGAAMPGAGAKTLEERLVVELAREVLRLRAETDALRAEIDRIKAR